MKKMSSFKCLLAILALGVSMGNLQAQEMTNTALEQSLSSVFKVEYKVTPNKDTINGALALAPEESLTWGDLSVIVRFNKAAGYIDAHNGTTYVLPEVADTLYYAADSTYTVAVHGNMYDNTYTTVVTGYDRKSDTVMSDTVALDNGFRKPAQSLNYLVKALQLDELHGVPGAELEIEQLSLFTTSHTAITHVDDRPVIDGSLADGYWDQLGENQCSSPYGGVLSSEDELSGSWKAVWTADSLFVMAHVKDGDLYDGGAPTWNTDGTHFYFGLSNLRNGLGAQGHDTSKVFTQFYYAADGSQPIGGNVPTVARHFLVANDTGYVLEVAFAWDDINRNGINFSPENGTQFLFDVDLVSYNADNQWLPKQLYWSSDMNCWETMDHAGMVELAKLDTTELAAARDQLQALIDAAVVGQENGQYLQSAVEAAEGAVAAAEQVLETAVAQSQLDYETASVNAAIAAFLPLEFPEADILTVSNFLPVIDGDISEWDPMSAQFNSVEVGAPLSGMTNLAGYWKAVWTADTIYVMVEVQDSVLSDDGAANWYTDGVHIYFGLEGLRDGLGAKDGMAKWFSQIYYTEEGAATGGSLVPASVSLATTDKGYVVEAAYAWENVSFAAGDKLLFDVDIVDFNVANYPRELYWGSAQNCYSIMDDAGRIILSGDEIIVESTEEMKEQLIRMYPNPAKNYLRIENIAGVHAISIYSASGSLVFSTENHASSSVIDLSGMAPGMYIVRMSAEGKEISRRFIRK